MDWPEALETVIDRTGHVRYRELTADEHPDHELWRGRIMELAGQPYTPPPPVHYPPIQQQAQNLFRSALGWARSGFKLAPRDVRKQRLAICEVCEKYDHVQKRCTVCGCVNSAKVWIATDKCPLVPPKWEAVK